MAKSAHAELHFYVARVVSVLVFAAIFALAAEALYTLAFVPVVWAARATWIHMASLAYVLNLAAVLEGRVWMVLGARPWYIHPHNIAVADNTMGPYDVLSYCLLRVPTCWVRTLPTVYVLGAQKAGTTSLHKYLTHHPAVCSAMVKETHVYDAQSPLGHECDKGERVRRRLVCAFYPTVFTAWYLRARHGCYHALDATPDVLLTPWVVAAMARDAPGARFIISLREPIDRAFSSHQMQRRAGREHLGFDEAIRKEEERFPRDRLEQECRAAGSNAPLMRAGAWTQYFETAYARRSRYAEQLSEVRAVLPPDRVRVIDCEELFAQPAATTGLIFAWLGVLEPEACEYIAHNSAPRASASSAKPITDESATDMSADTKAFLSAKLAPDIALYASICNRCSSRAGSEKTHSQVTETTDEDCH